MLEVVGPDEVVRVGQAEAAHVLAVQQRGDVAGGADGAAAGAGGVALLAGARAEAGALGVHRVVAAVGPDRAGAQHAQPHRRAAEGLQQRGERTRPRHRVVVHHPHPVRVVAHERAGDPGGEAARPADVAVQVHHVGAERVLVGHAAAGVGGGVVDHDDRIGPAVLRGEAVEALGEQLLAIVGDDHGDDALAERLGMGGGLDVAGPADGRTGLVRGCGVAHCASCWGFRVACAARPQCTEAPPPLRDGRGTEL